MNEQKAKRILKTLIMYLAINGDGKQLYVLNNTKDSTIEQKDATIINQEEHILYLECKDIMNKIFSDTNYVENLDEESILEKFKGE